MRHVESAKDSSAHKMKITFTSVIALVISLVGASDTVDFSQYPWIAPTSTDVRGPCPGLNTYVSILVPASRSSST